MESPKTLILRRFCGDEIFRISDAALMAWKNEKGGFDLNLEIETDPEPIQTQPDTREIWAEPNAEITLSILSFDPDDFAGRQFFLPNNPGYEEKVFLSRLYYCSHESVSSNRVEVIKQLGNRYHIRWSGETCDVNFYDGSKPVTKIEIDAIFTFEGYNKWKFA